jgi:glycosyltransferase involved in cell wall biosynthesis
MPDLAGIGCTVVARRDLPVARILARSYLDHHGDHEFVVVVLDPDDDEDTRSGLRIVRPDWLDLDRTDFLRLATAYDAPDLVRAVVPFALRQALAEAPVAIHLDSSSHVVGSLAGVVELAHGHDIVLIPQLLEPLPVDGKQPDATGLPVTGPFSAGFLAVGQGARPFLDHWAGWSRHEAPPSSEPRPGAHPHPVQQVPGLYRHTVHRDPGLDVGYWNAHERAPDTELRVVNFRGYDPDSPWLLSRHCPRWPRVLLSEHPALRRRAAEYRAALLAAGDPDTGEYGLGSLPDGSPLTAWIRRLFRHTWAAAERGNPDAPEPVAMPPHAFDGDAFREWLRSPGSVKEAAAGLNRAAVWAWTKRPDLQTAFRHPYREDAPAFRNWCRDHGVAEGMIPEWAVPAAPEPPGAPVAELGVNLGGFLTGELGLGEMGRIVHHVLRHAGVPVASVVEERVLTCRTDLPAPEDVGYPRFPVTILAVNADYTRMALETYPELGEHRYRIGLWAWELEDFPDWLHDAFALVDEVWTLSEFSRAAIAAHSPVPVKVIPLPVLDPGEPAAPRSGEPVQFLFLFDFNSTGQRKNATGLVETFRKAFPGRDDVRLVIKATNGERNPAQAERLRLLVRDDERVTLLERYLTVEELGDLYARSHAYASLHRSEGFGLTVAEAMIRGLPVISTDYSGTKEFVTEAVGWPVPYEMVQVGPGAQPYHADAWWAEPDLDHAARAMREIADNPTEAARRGKAAREHLLETRSVQRAAEWVLAELTAAYRSWREPATPDGRLRRTARAGVNRLRMRIGR